ncbi:MAG: photosynthetic complex assembly protein PuhC [Pseudomonadota bacterium]
MHATPWFKILAKVIPMHLCQDLLYRNKTQPRGVIMNNSDRIRRDRIDTIIMRTVFFFLVCIVILTALVRLSGQPLLAQSMRGPIQSERIIDIQSDIAGAARVTDIDGSIIADLSSGEGVFISVIDRAVRRERIRYGASQDGPVHLRLREGDKLSIHDPVTGHEINIMGYGPDNIAAIATLLVRN